MATEDDSRVPSLATQARAEAAAKPPERMSAKALREEAQRMNALALKTLGELMDGVGQDSVKLAAAREVLDRAHGKPKGAGPKARRTTRAPAKRGMTVIVKRFSEVTPEEQAAADETERQEW